MRTFFRKLFPVRSKTNKTLEIDDLEKIKTEMDEVLKVLNETEKELKQIRNQQ